MSERILTAGVKTEIDGAEVRPAYLIFFDFPSDPVYLTSAPQTVTWNSNDYLGLGNLIDVPPITESTDSGSKGAEIVLAGFDDDTLTDALGHDFQNSDCQIRIAFFDSSWALVNDPIMLHRGPIDKAIIRDRGTDSVISVKIESRMHNQLRPREYRYTDADQQLLYPGQGDRIFEFVPLLQNRHVEWG